MDVEIFNAGWLTADAGLWRRGDESGASIRVPVPVFLVESGDRWILIDTGLHPQSVADPGAYYERPEVTDSFTLELEQPITEQIDVDSITDIVLTHLHFDHAGGLALLPPSIPIFIQRREWEASHDPASTSRNGYFPIDYVLPGRRVVLVDGDHDLLGDDSVRLLLTPGHTPGHQSVRIGDDLVIGGDVAYFASGFADHVFPVYGDDRREQARSADRLRALQDEGVRVLPGHDPAVITPGPVSG